MLIAFGIFKLALFFIHSKEVRFIIPDPAISKGTKISLTYQPGANPHFVIQNKGTYSIDVESFKLRPKDHLRLKEKATFRLGITILEYNGKTQIPLIRYHGYLLDLDGEKLSEGISLGYEGLISKRPLFWFLEEEKLKNDIILREPEIFLRHLIIKQSSDNTLTLELMHQNATANILKGEQNQKLAYGQAVSLPLDQIDGFRLVVGKNKFSFQLSDIGLMMVYESGARRMPLSKIRQNVVGGFDLRADYVSDVHRDEQFPEHFKRIVEAGMEASRLYLTRRQQMLQTKRDVRFSGYLASTTKKKSTGGRDICTRMEKDSNFSPMTLVHISSRTISS
jgi:hypothetical protein